MSILKDSELKKFKEGLNSNSSANKNSGYIEESKVVQVLDIIAKEKGLPAETKNTTALALVTGLGQNGASNRSVGTISYEVNKVILTNIELREYLARIDKNATMRQFFRSIRNDVHTMAALLNEKGDLANLMIREYPNATNDELIWCSNFQTGNNNCPANVREFLNNNAKARFEKK